MWPGLDNEGFELNICAILNGKDDEGSTKYRLTQYRSFFEKKGIRLDTFRKSDMDKSVLDKVAEADLVLNQKCLFDAGLAKKIIATASATIFDMDDAIWTRPGKPWGFFTARRVTKRLHTWLKNATLVLVSNGFLAEYVSRCGGNVHIMPMSIPMDEWYPVENTSDEVVIGWAGSPVNLRYIRSIDHVLKVVKSKYENVRIRVYSGEDPGLEVDYEYIRYSRGTEPAFTRGLDIGLLPLEDDPYLKGKSPIKSIQYCACGLPVVGYIDGGTREILNDERAISARTDEEWILALAELVEDKRKRLQMGRNARDFALKFHDYEFSKYEFLRILQSVTQ